MHKKMVTLIYPGPDQIKSYRFGYSLLLLYIGTDLRNHGYDFSLLDYSVFNYTREELINTIKQSLAIVLEVDAFPLKRSSNIENARALSLAIKKVDKAIPIIAIGKQCTLFHDSMNFSDTTVVGDSELFVSKIIEKICRKETIEKFYDAGSIIDLSMLPPPAYDILSLEEVCGKTATYHMHLAPSALLETSRGCPGKCTFCQRKGWENRVLRFPLEKIRKNFSYLLDHGIKNIWITDENFPGNLSHAKEVLKIFMDERHGRDVKISMSSWVHIDCDFLDMAKQAGVSIISFGIESIIDKNQQFYQKHFNCEKLLKLLEHADSIGLYTVGNFIIGSPFDTHETVQANIEFAVKSKLDIVNIKTLDYMMGSELYERLPLDKQREIHFFSCKERGTATLPAAEIKKMGLIFLSLFQQARERSLAMKIQQYGPPYFKEQP